METLQLVLMVTAYIGTIAFTSHIAKHKGYGVRLSRFLGMLFGVFALIGYLVVESHDKKWKPKDSRRVVMKYLLFLVVVGLLGMGSAVASM